MWKLSLDSSGHITRLDLPDDEIGSALYDKMEPVVRGWHYTPGKLNGQPAATDTRLTVVVAFEPDGSDGYGVRVVSAKTGGATKNLVPPKYPMEAIRMGHGGLVLLKVEHDAEGRVVSAKPVKPKKGGVTDARLVNASLAAVKQWTFDPETVGGHGMPGSDVMPFCFSVTPVGEHRERSCVFELDDGQEPFETARPISLESVVGIDMGSSPAHMP